MSEDKNDIKQTGTSKESSLKSPSKKNAGTFRTTETTGGSPGAEGTHTAGNRETTRKKTAKKTVARKKKGPKVVFKKSHVAILAFSIIVVCSLILTVAVFRYSDPRGVAEKQLVSSVTTQDTDTDNGLQNTSTPTTETDGTSGTSEASGTDNLSGTANLSGTNNSSGTGNQNSAGTGNSASSLSPQLPDNALAMGGQEEKEPGISQGSREPEKPENDFGIPQAVGNPKIALVLDDGGYSLSDLQHFLDLPFPLAVAVLPQLNNSVAAAQKIRAAGKELLLHQPMQAINLKVDPGPGAITPTMHTYEIAEVVQQNIAQIGPVAGMNNHEGSLITESAPKIGAVLEVCKNAGIFFLDSRTTANSVVPQVAMELGMNILERDVFLDNTPNRDDILKEFLKGVKVANRDGYAIMIGHIWSGSNLANLLEEVYPVLKSKGYTLVTPGDLYENLGY